MIPLDPSSSLCDSLGLSLLAAYSVDGVPPAPGLSDPPVDSFALLAAYSVDGIPA